MECLATIGVTVTTRAIRQSIGALVNSNVIDFHHGAVNVCWINEARAITTDGQVNNQVKILIKGADIVCKNKTCTRILVVVGIVRFFVDGT